MKATLLTITAATIIATAGAAYAGQPGHVSHCSVVSETATVRDIPTLGPTVIQRTAQQCTGGIRIVKVLTPYQG